MKGRGKGDEKSIIKKRYIWVYYMVMGNKLGVSLPTFSEMIQYYGPYVGLVLFLIISTLVLQYIWFQKVIKAKNEEIKRLADREEKLNDRLIYMINNEIGIRKRDK